MMSSDHNQRLGFGKYGKKAHGREEQYKSKISSSKQEIKEIKISKAKTQLLAIGEIRKIISIIGGGKEATVLLAETSQGKPVCAKVFRFYTSTIKKRLRGTRHITASDMAALAAKQEYWNLYEMHKYVQVPKPLILLGNIVIMDFISKKEGSLTPAPLLRDIDLSLYDPEELLYESIDILAQLFLQGNFIHGDYSEHNLMLTQKGNLITMDVSQSVQYNTKTFVETPVRIRVDRAVKLLKADINNINQFFRRTYRLAIDPNEVTQEIINELPSKLKDYLTEKTMEIYPSELISTEVSLGKEQFRDEVVYQRTGSSRQQPK
ncbi:MAG: RIO1 family regulatory kinase/ATPase domain-containing protein [Candidatus Hodarchaeales archaeon]|jgi:serine/threonine-protein kinase RIO1